MYAGPPTSSRSPERPSSSLSVTRSIASLRSDSLTILSKMRRCASRKKSAESMTSAARLKASLCRRIAPSTERSASRLCGRVRSGAATSGIGGGTESVAEKRTAGATIAPAEPRTSNDERLFSFCADLDLQRHRDVAVQLERHRVVAELLDRLLRRAPSAAPSDG